MDIPNLPENEIEEITWQDDENRATLFLRSVFVLLSGALIVCQWPSLLNVLLGYTDSAGFNAGIRFFVLAIPLPISIIWFFLGQGLRPVEWLSDQKYNAWNYGCNFKEWKLHLKWIAGICGVPLLWTILLVAGDFKPMSSTPTIPFLLGTISLLVITWIIVTGVIWIIFGYLLFGCAQGFSPTTTIILLTAIVCWFAFAGKSPHDIFSVTVMLFVAFVTLAALTICWVTKSFAPVLYLALLSSSLIILYFALTFRGLMCC